MAIQWAALATRIVDLLKSAGGGALDIAKQYGAPVAIQGLTQSFNMMNALNFGNVAKVLTLDFKSDTRRAEGGFDEFAKKLSSKFLVTGLELSSLRASLDEINKQFSDAMQEQGIAFASENVALQNQVGTLFAVLKEGSVNAGAIMAENIRRSLGEVSKDVGSTTEDINTVLQLIPVTSKRALDSMGISMSDFASKALRLQTNVRVGLGENAVEFLNKALSGEADINAMKNDRTGVGQLMYRRFGMMPFNALAPEQRTQMVARMLNDEEFQQQIETLAERAGGFSVIFRRLGNTLFDSETGVFGVLKEVTIEFENFSGEIIKSTTSIFKEITELTRAIFDPKEGLFATLTRLISEAFGFDSDSALKIITRLIRFLRDGVNKINSLIQTDPFEDFLKGLKGVLGFIGDIGSALWAIVVKGDFRSSHMDKIQKGADSVITQLSDKILPFFTNIVEFIGERIQYILKSIIYVANNISYDGSKLLNALGKFVDTLLTQIGAIIPLGIQAITASFQSLVRNFGGYDKIKEGFLAFLKNLSNTLNTILDSLHVLVLEPIGSAIKTQEFADFFKEIGEIIGPTIARLLDTWVNWFLIQRESILTALTNMITPELENSITENLKKLVEFFVYITSEFLKQFITKAGPLLWNGLLQLGKTALDAVKGAMSGQSSATFTPPDFEITTPGQNYTTHASGNFFDAIETERSQSSVFARPVIANSDEIIIPKGRIQELNTNIENRVLDALSPALSHIAYRLEDDGSEGLLSDFILKLNDSVVSSLKGITGVLNDPTLRAPQDVNNIIAASTSEQLTLGAIQMQNREMLDITTHLLRVVDFVDKINENTKSTKEELTISNLLSAKAKGGVVGDSGSSAPINVQASLPPIDTTSLATPEFQEKVIETVKETVVQKQSQSFVDKLLGLVGLGKPAEAPVVIKEPTPTPAPTTPPTKSVPTSGANQPIQVVIQLDGKVLTDVVLTEIGRRTTQLNSAP